ncbi:bifunctional 4-hydroxy-2-oxoglutarate aldolase/2-dehydro-3-deoxy-phosphogluconate aldolase [Limnohabitans sp.]|uniref:bifunctional 4-hydroxy-2-oxoglutarate aldolase/2-dehydro-3-deoxy-phosphogluconate aldolase n=1 Tax=Limnohabitans sp. TaxID=1907725 RepID=UPI00286EF1EA|nr:bifunctional 4-hydroxy-2-oxoglutarate aldolase/2-dehydro-3-deoxy-phosphogluconate aldolase [Limnohabitans sp.]
MPITPRTMREILARTPVMPILTIHDASTAGDLAQALVKGGIHVFEVVMRTPQAVAAVKAMREATPEADIGMGTLMTPEDVIRAHHAGAQFGVSPGLTPELAQAIQAHRMAFLPGVATASEVMQARAFGLKELKYFPAQGPIGAAWLKDMSQVFPDVIFCPTGGIRPPHIPDYLALPNCSTVGGSWIVPPALLNDRDWAGITALAQQARRFQVS